MLIRYAYLLHLTVMQAAILGYFSSVAKKPVFSVEVPPEVSAYMSAIGSKKTAAKTAASRINAAKASAASRKNPLDLPCTCSGGESLNPDEHKSTCPRGHLLKQRAKAAAKRAQKEIESAA